MSDKQQNKSTFNPFYVLALLSGLAFTITACLMGWMIYLDSRRFDDHIPRIADSPLLTYLHNHTLQIFVIELTFLGLSTLGSFVWDQLTSPTPAGKTEKTADQNAQS